MDFNNIEPEAQEFRGSMVSGNFKTDIDQDY